MELDLNFLPVQLQTQRTQMSASMQYERWRVDPIGQLPDEEALKHVNFAGSRQNLNQFWMGIRRRIFAQGEEGGNVNVGIQGNTSSGKSEAAQAILHLASHDFFLHTHAKKKGIKIVPRTMPFALAAKAFQVPILEGGPGLIRSDVDHGGFTEGDYWRISVLIQDAFNKAVVHPDPGVVNVNILEGSGLPYPKRIGYPVELAGMADRGVSPIDNLAFHHTQSANSFILLMSPNAQVQEFGLSEREFDPDTNDLGSVFRGRMRYIVSSRAGVIYNIADLDEPAQRDTLKFLRMAMAPKNAAVRSRGEYVFMKQNLVDEGVMPDSRDDTYMEVKRNRLLTRIPGHPGIPAKNVVVAETSFVSSYREIDSNVRNLDYLLRYCVWSQSVPEMVPASLRRFL